MCVLFAHTSLLPQKSQETTIVANPRRIFSNAHNYHVNSISVNVDGETFLSADDLRIHLWNVERSEECFNVVDIKPATMEDLTEVITSAQFHPQHCHIMLHSSSKGTIKIGDMRSRALIDNQAKILEGPPQPAEARTFFSEILASISDAKFSPDGRYIVSRDYMTLKLWDVNMERAPIQEINLQEHLTPKFVELYENDCIFDKFECACSGDGRFVASGSYDNTFKIYDAATAAEEATVSMGQNLVGEEARAGGSSMFNFREKVLHMAWEAKDDVLAVCGRNRLYLYSAVRDRATGGLRGPEGGSEGGGESREEARYQQQLGGGGDGEDRERLSPEQEEEERFYRHNDA